MTISFSVAEAIEDFPDPERPVNQIVAPIYPRDERRSSLLKLLECHVRLEFAFDISA